jgi:hypothetical protein
VNALREENGRLREAVEQTDARPSTVATEVSLHIASGVAEAKIAAFLSFLREEDALMYQLADEVLRKHFHDASVLSNKVELNAEFQLIRERVKRATTADADAAFRLASSASAMAAAVRSRRGGKMQTSHAGDAASEEQQRVDAAIEGKVEEMRRAMELMEERTAAMALDVAAARAAEELTKAELNRLVVFNLKKSSVGARALGQAELTRRAEALALKQRRKTSRMFGAAPASTPATSREHRRAMDADQLELCASSPLQPTDAVVPLPLLPRAQSQIGMRSAYGVFSDFGPRRVVAPAEQADDDQYADDAPERQGVAFRIAITAFFEDVASALREADKSFHNLEEVHHELASNALAAALAPPLPSSRGPTPQKPNRRAGGAPAQASGRFPTPLTSLASTHAPRPAPVPQRLVNRLNDVVLIDFLDRPAQLQTSRVVTELLKLDGTWDDEVELLALCQTTLNEFLHRHAEHYKLQIGRHYDATVGGVGNMGGPSGTSTTFAFI